jgi:PKD repeat protein
MSRKAIYYFLFIAQFALNGVAFSLENEEKFASSINRSVELKHTVNRILGDISKKELLRMAREFTSKRQSLKARKIYLYLVEVDSSNFDYNFELAMNYHLETNDCKCCALSYFERAIRNISRIKKVYEIFYYTAKTYQFCEKYDEAILNYNKFLQHVNSRDVEGEFLEVEVQKKIKSCELAKVELNRFNNRFEIQKLNGVINTIYAEYAPVVNSTDSILMYTTRSIENSSGQINLKENTYFEDMYISFRKSNQFDSTQKFSEDINYISEIRNSASDDRVIWISYSDSLLITYKNQVLYYSILDKNKWTRPTIFPRNINMATKQRHASISPDGKTIYFSSNADEGFGGMDIYKATKNEDGSWSEAVNLGIEINSAEDEDSPNISNDGKTLYYSSKNNSLGGYDIFVTTQLDSLTWTKPENLGIPFNSSGDDQFFRPNADYTEAYFSSYRKAGNGDFDIYKTPITANDFTPYKNQSLSIYLDATGSIDNEGAKLVYEWDFGDGEKSRGITTEHVYAKPGKYTVNLNIIDSITGAIEMREASIQIDLSNINYIDIKHVDKVKANTRVSFDASKSTLKNDTITEFLWDFGDNTTDSGNVVNHEYKQEGTYWITLKVDSQKLQNEKKNSFVFTRPVMRKKIIVDSNK